MKFSHLCVLKYLFFILLSTEIYANLTLQPLENEDALCNDGSKAGYYWKPASNESSKNIWIVYLEGGDWCWDQESCYQRCGSPPNFNGNHLCSSKNWESSIPIGGIFWPESEQLQEANKVFVKYCTSDAHNGNAEAFGMHFKGRIVVDAILMNLIFHKGLGQGPTKDLLIFGGGSAGGRGAMMHLDYVPEMLGSVQSNVEVKGFLDSPLWMDVTPYNSYEGFAKVTQGVYSFANIKHTDSQCDKDYPGDQGWKCLFGQYRMPYLKTSYMLIASQYDAYQLGKNVGHEPSNDSEKKYAENLALKTSQLIKSLWDMGQSKENQTIAVYSWACYNHCTSTSNGGFNTHVCQAGDGTGSYTMNDALEQFLGFKSQSSSPKLQWIDRCDGFACGNGCYSAKKNQFLQ